MKISLVLGLLFILIFLSSVQACSNPILRTESGVAINPFGGELRINGTKYDGFEIEYNLQIKNLNDQGLMVSLQPSSRIKDYIFSEPIIVEANSIKIMPLKIWVGGKSEYGTIEINYICGSGSIQYLNTYFNLVIIGKGISPPPSSSCNSYGLDGCYSGLYRDYYCSNDQLQYKSTCMKSCCQSFEGKLAFCSNDNSECISPNPNMKLEIEIHSPENKTHGEKKFLINVSTNIPTKYIYYALNGNRFKQACQYCRSYLKQYSAKEGLNELIIRAEDYWGNKTNSSVIFTVDSEKPYIRSIEPDDGEYIKGSTFKVQYTEENLKSISLFYGIEGSMEEYLMYNCPSGRNKECNIEIDVSPFDGQKIQYYFVVKDEVHSTISNVNEIYVDKTIPTIKINSPSGVFNISKLLVNLNVSEKVVSLEYSDNGKRFKRLCRDCNYYSKTLLFSDGIHNLTFKATDNAGNQGYASVIFTVDTKGPKIKNIAPNDGGYIKGSDFTVYYDEDSVKNVSLFYGKEGSMKEYFMDYCPSGNNQECTATVELNEYDGEVIQYYFIVRSDFYEDKSETYSLNVDTKTPTVTINSPNNGTTYASRSVQLNISVSEDVELEYSDNGGRFSRLCSNCDSYDHSYYFSYDIHNLTIRATDNAGNEAYASVLFTIKR